MGMLSLKKIAVFSFVLFVAYFAHPVDLTFKFTPLAEFPLVTGETRRYDIAGGGGFLDLGVDLFDFLNIGAEVGYVVLPKENFANIEEGSDPIVSFVPGGAQLGLFFYPFSRGEVSLGVAGGACISIMNGKNHYAPWYRGTAEIGYRINPSLSLTGNASCFIAQYDSWWGNPGALGVTAGLSIKYRLNTRKVVGNVSTSTEYEDSVFPLFYSIYREAPFGEVTIHNNESAEIKNVKVSFRAGKYTSADIQCGSVRIIRKNKSHTIPILADWSGEILQFSEEGKLPGEIVVEYDFLGQKRTVVSEVIVPVYNRNQMRWADAGGIASFISTMSQEVLEFSKTLVGISRNYLRTGLDRNMQFAMYLFDGMMLSGIEIQKSMDTPYESYHTQPELVDYIQYPFQTMQFRSGDVDDIGVLYLAMLESVGISTAFIPMQDDFIVCFGMGIKPSQIENHFYDVTRVFEMNDMVWIPLSMANIREGFVNSWNHALKKIEQYGEDSECIILSEAWEVYPPSGYSPKMNLSMNVNDKQLISSAETEVARYIASEIGPKIANIQAQIKEGEVSDKLYNQLGMLYVRAGMYPSAIAAFEVSAKNGSVTAMNNIGNIYNLQKKPEEAKEWYKLALEQDPNNATARKNLSRLEDN